MICCACAIVIAIGLWWLFNWLKKKLDQTRPIEDNTVTPYGQVP